MTVSFLHTAGCRPALPARPVPAPWPKPWRATVARGVLHVHSRLAPSARNAPTRGPRAFGRLSNCFQLPMTFLFALERRDRGISLPCALPRRVFGGARAVMQRQGRL